MNRQHNRINITSARVKDTAIDQFAAGPGQAWCIVGANRSGIEDFFDLVAGQAEDATAEYLVLPENPGVVSFDRQQKLYEAELKKDDTDFLDRLDDGTPAREFLNQPDRHNRLIRAFGMESVLEKGFRQLSTGQCRKLMVLSWLTRNVSCLIVQSPYDGLDHAACRELDRALAPLHRSHILVVLFLTSTDDIPSWCTHVAVMADHRLTVQGERARVVNTLGESPTSLPDFRPSAERVYDGSFSEENQETPLVRLVKGAAGYNGCTVFSNLDLVIRPGEHTLVTGPNGCGKSTLLQMITGDHPACYQNDLTIFSIQRGSGESIWEIKQHLGIVSPELHRNYRVPGTVLHCILSGLFDSIGLYRSFSSREEEKAREWLEWLGMADEAATPFRELGFAAQRLVLLARALIKAPRLLVLDEPTHGLDQVNRNAVLDFLETVARQRLATILYVSHRTDEFRPFFVNRLDMTHPMDHSNC